MARTNRTLRELVDARANGRREYCHRYKILLGKTFFEVEHIYPRSLGGITIPQNLAFACRRCNLFKSNEVSGFDTRMGQTVILFNPRTHLWHEHFRRSRDLLRIYGRSAIGRVTVEQLQLITSSEQIARQLQRDYLADVCPLD